MCGKSSGTLMECEFELNGSDRAVCSRSYHVKCAGLSRVPEGEFICPKHSGKPSDSDDSGSVYNDSGSDSSFSSDDSSTSEISSDEDLGALVDRHRKVAAQFSPLQNILTVSRWPEEASGKIRIKLPYIWEAADETGFQILNPFRAHLSF